MNISTTKKHLVRCCLGLRLSMDFYSNPSGYPHVLDHGRDKYWIPIIKDNIENLETSEQIHCNSLKNHVNSKL